ncbi:hypothetical protein ABPG75_002513 [Micractinium tetrahymenae]
MLTTLSARGAAPLLRAAGPALCSCSPSDRVRPFSSQQPGAAPAGTPAAAAATVDNAAASPFAVARRRQQQQAAQPPCHRGHDHQEHAISAPAGRGSLTHVRCLACGGWHAVPAAAHAQPPPRSLPLLSTHRGRPCRGLTISLAAEMARESGAVIDRHDVEAARRPFRTLFGRVPGSRLSALHSRAALAQTAARLMAAAAAREQQQLMLCST